MIRGLFLGACLKGLMLLLLLAGSQNWFRFKIKRHQLMKYSHSDCAPIDYSFFASVTDLCLYLSLPHFEYIFIYLSHSITNLFQISKGLFVGGAHIFNCTHVFFLIIPWHRHIMPPPQKGTHKTFEYGLSKDIKAFYSR